MKTFKQYRDHLFGIYQLKKDISTLKEQLDNIGAEINAIHVLNEKVDGVDSKTDVLNEKVDGLGGGANRLKEQLKGLDDVTNAVHSSMIELKQKLPDAKFESYDVAHLARWQAGFTSVSYYNQHLYNANNFSSDIQMIEYALHQARPQGLVLEFGVFSGRTINTIADNVERGQTVYGFDSFEGLPEGWRSDFPQGAFAVKNLPEVRENVCLIQGWFSDTLPSFITEHPESISFLHVDCDLYSSTKTIFEALKDRFLVGSIIVFDEYFNYPGWEQHEFKAFQEFVKSEAWEYEYLGSVPTHQQVMVQLKNRRKF